MNLGTCSRCALVLLSILGASCADPAGEPPREGRRDVASASSTAETRVVDHLGGGRTTRRVPVVRASLSEPRGIEKAVAVALGSRTAGALAFSERQRGRDARGLVHARLRQMRGSVPVLGGEAIAHLEPDGEIRRLTAWTVPAAETVDTTPTVSLSEAATAASSEFASDVPRSEARVARNELVVFALDPAAPPRLAYDVEVRSIRGAAANRRYAVDARTGEVFWRLDQLMTLEGSGKGTLGASKKLQVAQSGGKYALVDTTHGEGIETYSAGNGTTLPGTLVTSASPTTWPAAAVDAHANAAHAYDFFKALGRDGIDGRGGSIVSTVDFDQNHNNASWNGEQMIYGSGDGKQFRAFSAGLDVVAHELAHGVTGATSGLLYVAQPGALNESFSDVMGAFTEQLYEPASKPWLLGENVSIDTEAFRDMAHPHRFDQPAHFSEFVLQIADSIGVHTNSGIPNNAAYLMTLGGKNDVSGIVVPAGIGAEKTAKLWYHANANYWGLLTGFVTAATEMLDAAADLGFTEREQSIVECAWIAAGVLDGNCQVAPAPEETEKEKANGGAAGGATAEGKNPKSESPLAAASETPGASEGGCSVTTPSGPSRPYAGLVLGLALALASRRRRRQD